MMTKCNGLCSLSSGASASRGILLLTRSAQRESPPSVRYSREGISQLFRELSSMADTSDREVRIFNGPRRLEKSMHMLEIKTGDYCLLYHY